MHRAHAIQLLSTYNPTDLQEQQYKRRMLDFIAQHPGCFERTNMPGHITASAWVVDRSGTRALLTHHAKLGMWIQVGGHCDGDADVLRVALKEAHEESGLIDLVPVRADIFDIDIHEIPAHKDTPAHEHFDIRFLLQATRCDTLCISDESLDLAWFTDTDPFWSAAPRTLQRMYSKWREKNYCY